MLLLACNGAPKDEVLTADDVAVYEAVIEGYAQAGQVLMLRLPPGPPPTDSGTAPPPESGPRTVRMRPNTVPFRDFAPRPDRWVTLDGQSRPHIDLPPSALADLRARNQRETPLTAFHPKQLRVEWSEKVGTLNCLYQLTLPGYSRSKNDAVVEISCATWALAGGGELLYLHRTDGRWRVVAKQQTWVS